MLPVNLLTALKEYTLTQRALPTATTDVGAKSGQQFEVGQRLQGTVQSQASPGVFKLNVAGQIVEMELPSSTRSGDTVPLQVVATQPRLIFSMVNSANPLSTPEQLGATARMLSSLSQQAPEKAYVRAAQSAPLWEMAQPPESGQLANLLHEALSNSGLFYESHQVQWLAGARSTTQLMEEPQNLAQQQAKVVAAGDPSNKTGEGADATTRVINDSRFVAIDNTVQGGSSNQPDTSLMSDSKAVEIPEHLQPLVQQQLNALETSQLLWQGNVWPGQEMRWEVHEQASQPPEVEEQKQWVTQIELDLPNLGLVTATLKFNNAGLVLGIKAGTSQTRTVLGNASTSLVTALTEAGIPVLSAQVL